MSNVNRQRLNEREFAAGIERRINRYNFSKKGDFQ